MNYSFQFEGYLTQYVYKRNNNTALDGTDILLEWVTSGCSVLNRSAEHKLFSE